MKLAFNTIPLPEKFFEIESSKWARLKEPSFIIIYFLGSVTAFLAPILIYLGFDLFLHFNLKIKNIESYLIRNSLSELSVFLLIIVLLIVHELLHTITYPNFGLDENTYIIIIPKKMMAAVVFNGESTKLKLIITLLTPLLLLTVLPLTYCVFCFNPILFATALANSSLSGADIVTAFTIIKNAPNKSILKNYGFDSYYRV